MVVSATTARREELRGHAAMLVFSALVAGSFSFGGRIANEIDPMALTAVRFLLTGVLIGSLAALRREIRRAAFRAPWRYGLLGGLFASYFILMFTGLKTAHPVSVSAVFTLTPIFAAGFGWLLLRQVTTRTMAAALTVGAVGALWVIFDASLSNLLAFRVGKGELVYLVGCIAHACYIPMMPRLNRGEPLLVYTFGMVVAGTLLSGIAGASAIAGTDWAALPGRVWLVLFYLVCGASVMTFLLLQYASMRLKAANVMAYTYLTPVWVILWELALAGQVPSPVLLPGVAMAVLALLVLLRAR